MAFTILVGCQQKKTETDTADATAYACPMKCEGETVYPVAGKCPVCGMDLVPVTPGQDTIAYEMLIVTTPTNPEAGKPVSIAFTPKIIGNESAQVPLDEVHEKKIHVIIVSQDLGWYHHIHPEYQADGSYVVSDTFPGGGEYIVFADYQPTGAGNQVQRRTFTVAGEPKKVETFTTQSLSTKTDGYTVTLKPTAGKFLTNNLNHIGVDVTLNGKPVTDFEMIMGAKGHLVIISGDGQHYLHVHPDEVDGKLDLHTQFDHPGIYRAFFQFQTNGKLHTSYFTLEVKEGKPGELENAEGHDHEGHTHDHGEEHDHSH